MVDDLIRNPSRTRRPGRPQHRSLAQRWQAAEAVVAARVDRAYYLRAWVTGLLVLLAAHALALVLAALAAGGPDGAVGATGWLAPLVAPAVGAACGVLANRPPSRPRWFDGAVVGLPVATLALVLGTRAAGSFGGELPPGPLLGVLLVPPASALVTAAVVGAVRARRWSPPTTASPEVTYTTPRTGGDRATVRRG